MALFGGRTNNIDYYECVNSLPFAFFTCCIPATNRRLNLIIHCRRIPRFPRTKNGRKIACFFKVIVYKTMQWQDETKQKQTNERKSGKGTKKRWETDKHRDEGEDGKF